MLDEQAWALLRRLTHWVGQFKRCFGHRAQRVSLRQYVEGLLGDSPAFASLGRAAEKPDFVELVAGKAKGRTSSQQITFYRNIGNQGLQFSSVGGWVYQQAVNQKKGREIPTAWFLQDIRD